MITYIASNYPNLAYAAVVLLGVLLAMCVIVLRWIVLGRLQNQGYRVMRIALGRYVYEEKLPERPFQEPGFFREFLWAFGIGWPRLTNRSSQVEFRALRGFLRDLRGFL